jgi:biopolymer transport protein ExbD
MEEENIINQINLTSLVDVSLTLVIIFMVVAPFMMETSIKVASSKMGERKGKVAQAENVNVYLNAVGEVKINGKPVPWVELASELRATIPGSKDRMVILLAAPENPVRKIVEVLDCARNEGAKKLAILKK